VKNKFHVKKKKKRKLPICKLQRKVRCEKSRANDVGKEPETQWRVHLSATRAANKIAGLASLKEEREREHARDREERGGGRERGEKWEEEESETQEPRGGSRQRGRGMNERTYVVRDTENGGGA